MDPWDVPLLATEQFVVVPTKGALVPGWALVIPRVHALCFAELRPTVHAELDDVLATTEHTITAEYGPCTIFEHGARAPGTAFGCGIDHAHLHVTPLAFSLLEATAALDRRIRWSTSDAPWFGNSLATSYLSVREPDAGWMVSHPQHIPSQFFRRAIAAALGTPHTFGYDEHPFPAMAADLVRRFGRTIHRRTPTAA